MSSGFEATRFPEMYVNFSLHGTESQKTLEFVGMASNLSINFVME
jgi:hypothetical protein